MKYAGQRAVAAEYAGARQRIFIKICEKKEGEQHG